MSPNLAGAAWAIHWRMNGKILRLLSSQVHYTHALVLLYSTVCLCVIFNYTLGGNEEEKNPLSACVGTYIDYFSWMNFPPWNVSMRRVHIRALYRAATKRDFNCVIFIHERDIVPVRYCVSYNLVVNFMLLAASSMTWRALAAGGGNTYEMKGKKNKRQVSKWAACGSWVGDINSSTTMTLFLVLSLYCYKVGRRE